MKKSPAKKIIYSGAAIILGLGVAVLIAEVIVRAFDLAPGVYRISQGIHRLSPDPDLRYELKPYSTEWGEAVNADGRRDFHYPREKAGNTFRVAVLGDSVTYGWACHLWNSHPKALEYFLNHFQKEKAVHFEAFNFGVRGYGTPEEVACLKNKALRIDPDLVILAYYLNDPDPFSVDLTGLLSLRGWADEQYMRDARQARQSRMGRFLVARSKLFTFVKYRAYARMQKDQEKPIENADGKELVSHWAETNYEKLKSEYFYRITNQHWDRVKKGLAEFASVAKSQGIPYVLMIFPCLDDLENYKYQPIHDRVAIEGQKNGFVVLDVKTNLLKAQAVWPGFDVKADFNHPNWRGQRVAGWTAARRLIDEGMLPVARESFKSELFEFKTVRPDIDMKIYEDRDMFQIEWGLWRINDKDYEAALDAFKKAYELNPKNGLVPVGLKRLIDECGEKAIQAQSIAFLKQVELRL